jgi:hypothetical protein
LAHRSTATRRAARRRALHADLQAGTLRSILTDWQAPEISLYAIYRRRGACR